MNNPMSFNFFTASGKSELPLGRNRTFSLSSLLSWHLLLQQLELSCNAFLALLTKSWRCSSRACHLCPLLATSVWKTSLSPLLSVYSQNDMKPANKESTHKVSSPCYRSILALSKPSRIYACIGCVSSCFHFTDGKHTPKECSIQCLTQDHVASQNLVPVSEYPSITGYFTHYQSCFACINIFLAWTATC